MLGKPGAAGSSARSEDFHDRGNLVGSGDRQNHGAKFGILVFFRSRGFCIGDGPRAGAACPAEDDFATAFFQNDLFPTNLDRGVGEGPPNDLAGGFRDLILDSHGSGQGVEFRTAHDFFRGSGVGIGKVEGRLQRVGADQRAGF